MKSRPFSLSNFPFSLSQRHLAHLLLLWTALTIGFVSSLEAIVWEEKKMGLVLFSLPSEGRITFEYDAAGRLLKQAFYQVDEHAVFETRNDIEEHLLTNRRGLELYAHESYRYDAAKKPSLGMRPNQVPMKTAFRAHYECNLASVHSACLYEMHYRPLQHVNYECRQKIGQDYFILYEARRRDGHLCERALEKYVASTRDWTNGYSSDLHGSERTYFDEDRGGVQRQIRWNAEHEIIEELHFHRDAQQRLQKIEETTNLPHKKVRTLIVNKPKHAREGDEASEHSWQLTSLSEDDEEEWRLIEESIPSQQRTLHMLRKGRISWKALFAQNAVLLHSKEVYPIYFCDGQDQLCGVILTQKDHLGRTKQIDYSIKEELFCSLSPFVSEQFHLLGEQFSFEEGLAPSRPTSALIQM